MIQTPEEIIKSAIDKYKPSHYVLMVSGGHDSITAAHVSSKILDKIGLVYQVYLGTASQTVSNLRNRAVKSIINMIPEATQKTGHLMLR